MTAKPLNLTQVASKIRDRLGMSQKAFGVALGYGGGAGPSNYERGRQDPKPYVRRMLACPLLTEDERQAIIAAVPPPASFKQLNRQSAKTVLGEHPPLPFQHALQLIRKRHKLTQDAMARLMGMHRTTFNKMEKNHAPVPYDFVQRAFEAWKLDPYEARELEAALEVIGRETAEPPPVLKIRADLVPMEDIDTLRRMIRAWPKCREGVLALVVDTLGEPDDTVLAWPLVREEAPIEATPIPDDDWPF